VSKDKPEEGSNVSFDEIIPFTDTTMKSSNLEYEKINKSLEPSSLFCNDISSR
jgi:hypothetical protein